MSCRRDTPDLAKYHEVCTGARGTVSTFNLSDVPEAQAPNFLILSGGEKMKAPIHYPRVNIIHFSYQLLASGNSGTELLLIHAVNESFGYILSRELLSTLIILVHGRPLGQKLYPTQVILLS